MKVGIYTGALASGGAEKQSLLLARVLNQEHQVTVVSYFGKRKLPRMVEFAKKHEISVIYQTQSPLRKALEFRSICRAKQFDVVFCYLPGNNIIAGLLLLGTSTRVIGGVRTNQLPFPKSVLLKIMHNWFLDRTIINNTNGLEKFSAIGWKGSKFAYIPNCIDNIPEPIRRTESDVIRIITVARFEDYKDYPTAFRTVKSLKEKLTDIKVEYRILGTGSLQAPLQQMVSEMGLNDVVKWVIDPNDINSHYRDCHIFLLTSVVEGFSNTILEAMAHSLPVVATNAGDNATMVKNGHNGYLTEFGDYRQLCDYLLELIRNTSLRHKMAENAYQEVNRYYGTGTFKNNYQNFLNQLVNG